MVTHVSEITHLVHPSRVKSGRIASATPVPGKQAMVTPTVKEFASQFRITSEISSLKPVIRAVKDFKLESVPYEEMKGLYAQRTATDIIHSKTALAMKKADRDKHYNIRGCVDYGLALTATLRALGKKAWFARTGDRTIVFFEHGGKEWGVDPSRHTRHAEPFELKDFEKKFFEDQASKGQFAKGKDAWHLKITSIQDFDRYSAHRKQG
jgi:hypothetical protein